MVPLLRIAGCATWAIASVNSGACAAISGDRCEIDMARQRADGKDIASYGDSLQFGEPADIDEQFRRHQTQIHRGHQALATRKHLRRIAVRGEQFQRVHNAGCACVAESRGFHGRDLPAGFQRIFCELDGGDYQRSSLFIERLFPANSTFGLVIMRSRRARVRYSSKIWSQGGARHESGFLHDADPSSRQGLAAIPERRSRSFPAGRRTRVYRSLCR